MCLKQLFAKQVPVTAWPCAKALPSTPLLLNVSGMWEKLVTLGLPIHCTTSVTSEVWAFQSQSLPATQLRAPHRDAFSWRRFKCSKKRPKSTLVKFVKTCPPFPSPLPSFSLFPPAPFLPKFPSSLSPSSSPPLSLLLPLPTPLLSFLETPPSLLPGLPLPSLWFCFLFCFIFEGSSVLNVLKIIIKYSWRFLGLGPGNLDFSADQAFWFFLTKENQIFCIP